MNKVVYLDIDCVLDILYQKGVLKSPKLKDQEKWSMELYRLKIKSSGHPKDIFLSRQGRVTAD